MTDLKMLDCFCGLGGASSGFAKEGFDCTGIDIINVGYPYRFILADMLTLKGEDFRGYDVIWGSPPCRDFSIFAKRFGTTWKKNPPNPTKGLELIHCYLKFKNEAKPTIWIMENSPYLAEHLGIKPRFISCLGPPEKQQMRRAFWGNFPNFLMQIQHNLQVKRFRPEVGRKAQSSPAERAKIPLACSQAFARACKDVLLEKELTV
jgi:site-specific DNA-cytosine methylase